MLHDGGEGIDWSKDIDNMEKLAAKVNALKPKPSFIFCTGKSRILYAAYHTDSNVRHSKILGPIVLLGRPKVAHVRFDTYRKFIPGVFLPASVAQVE